MRDWNLVKRPAPPPPPGDECRVTYVTHRWAAGYRDVTLSVRFEGAADDSPPTELAINARDCEAMAQDLFNIHNFVWRDGREPIDKQAGELRPSWLP